MTADLSGLFPAPALVMGYADENGTWFLDDLPIREPVPEPVDDDTRRPAKMQFFSLKHGIGGGAGEKEAPILQLDDVARTIGTDKGR